MAILIEFNSNLIQSGKDNSMIFNGENQLFGWSSPLKQNNVFAPGGSYFAFPRNFNLIADNDAMDMPVYEPRFAAGISSQQI